MREKIRVLYIEDNPEILNPVKLYLENSGACLVTPVTDVPKATFLLTSQPFDIIVSDYNLSGTDGLTFFLHVREIGNSIPFILFSERVPEDVIIKALNAGVNYYLPKGDEIESVFEDLFSIIISLVKKQLQESNNREEEKIAHVIEYLPDPMFVMNDEGIVIAWNRAIEGMTLVQKKDILGKGDHAYSLPFYGERREMLVDRVYDDDSSLISKHSDLHQKEPAISTEVFVPQLYGGKGAYVRIVGTPFCNEKGVRIGQVVSIRDISDKKTDEYELIKKSEEIQAAYEELSASEEELRSNLNELITKEILLLQSNEKYHALYMNMVEGAALHDLILNERGVPVDYRIIDINPAYEKILGLTREKVVGKTAREAYGVPEPPYLDIYAKVAITGEPVSFEVYFEPLEMYISISAYCPYKGSFATIFFDITERKLADEALRKSEMCLREAQTLSLTGSWELNLITNHLVLSDFVYDIFEIEKKDNAVTYDTFLGVIHPDDREVIHNILTHSQGIRTPGHIEYRLLMPDGRIKNVIGKYETRYDPLGKHISSLGTIQDITERKKVELTLKETNEYLENLITIANVPIIIWDSSFRIIRLNHAFENLIGRPADEIIGISLEFLFPVDQAGHSMLLLKKTMEGVRWDTTEIDLLHKDGTIRTIQWNSATLYSSDGKKPVATIAQGYDITRERRLERERDSALSQIKHNLAYLAILNDEIRNPLNIIIALSDLVQDPSFFEQISVQVQRIDLIVGQLDRRWIESEKILDYLRKYHQVIFTEPSSLSERKYTGEIVDLIKEEETVSLKHQQISEELQATLYAILDSVDACLYIIDPDTYDLLYVNQRGREVYGNIIGKKCYEHLNQGGFEQCSFCPKKVLKDKSTQNDSYPVHDFEFKNPWNGRWYEGKARIIRWTDGRTVLLEFIADVSEYKEIEKELTHEKSLVRFIENSIHIGSWRYSFQTGKMTWSDGMYTIFGMSKNPVYFDKNLFYLSMVHPDDRFLVDQFQEKILLDKIPRPLEFRILKSDGSVCWIHSVGKREYDESGEVIAISGFTCDITRNKLENRELIDTRKKLESVLLFSHFGTWEWNISTGTCAFSEGWADILGYMVSDLAPVSIQTLISFIHPEDVDRAKSCIKLHISGDLPYFDTEIRMRHKNGEWKWIKARGSIVSHTDDGKPLILFGTYQDVTGQKLDTTRLCLSEMRYKSISDSTTDFVFSCTRIGKDPYAIDWISGAVESITGFSLDEILALGCWRTLVHPDDLTIFDEAVIHLKPGTSGNATVRIIRKDGEIRWVVVQTTQIPSDDQSFSDRIYGGCRDITDQKIAEEKLRIIQEKYTKAFLSCPDAFSISDLLSGLFIEVNDKSMQYYGYSREEMIGRSSLELGVWLKDEDREHFLRTLLSEGKTDWFETVHCRKNKDTFDVAISAEMITLDGKSCIISTIRDITHLKKTEASLRESENRYHNLVQNLPGNIMVHRKGKILYMNPGGASAIGYTPEEVIRTNLTDYLIPESARIVKDVRHQMMSGNTISPYELTVRNRYGVLKVIEIRNAIIQYEGAPAILCSFSDITERKEIEEALRRSEAKYRRFVEYANDAIIVAQNGYLVLVNPRMVEMTGYSKEELLSAPFTAFIHDDDQEMVLEMYRKRLQGENPPSRYNFKLIKKNREIMWVEISTVLIEWDNTPATLSYLMDITERRQAEEALRESNRKLRLLTSLTRHDIFNQLSAIGLLLSMAFDSSDCERIHEYIGHARTASDRIETIIGFTREYEDFGVVSSGWKVIHTIIESAMGEVVLGAISVQNEVPMDLEIYGDPIIRKVFTTLLENASRHGEKITRIRFYCLHQDQEMVIVCEDDGIGIPEDEKMRIFEHGFGSHTGIGLFLVQEILSITGLSIRETGKYGHGARFEIVIPQGKYRQSVS